MHDAYAFISPLFPLASHTLYLSADRRSNSFGQRLIS